MQSVESIPVGNTNNETPPLPSFDYNSIERDGTVNPSLSGGEEKESTGINSTAQLETINQIKKNKRFKVRKQKGSRNKFTIDMNTMGRSSPYNYR